MNLLSATAARVAERKDESERSSAESDNDRVDRHTGSLELVRKTLTGIAAHDEDEGSCGLGRHAGIIRLGSGLWATPALTQQESATVVERFLMMVLFPKLKMY